MDQNEKRKIVAAPGDARRPHKPTGLTPMKIRSPKASESGGIGRN